MTVLKLADHQTKVNEDALNLLRGAIERVEKGEVSDVAIVCVNRDGSCNTSCSDGTQFQAMIGSLEILKHRLLLQNVD